MCKIHSNQMLRSAVVYIESKINMSWT